MEDDDYFLEDVDEVIEVDCLFENSFVDGGFMF